MLSGIVDPTKPFLYPFYYPPYTKVSGIQIQDAPILGQGPPRVDGTASEPEASLGRQVGQPGGARAPPRGCGAHGGVNAGPRASWGPVGVRVCARGVSSAQR